ncbi:hypothetical protein B0H12DRAFT_1103779 [Mycena haematopus]|nr:hypothetical protein B0H12DRAFT_1103779 [Mycena haematopus]
MASSIDIFRLEIEHDDEAIFIICCRVGQGWHRIQTRSRFPSTSYYTRVVAAVYFTQRSISNIQEEITTVAHPRQYVCWGGEVVHAVTIR